MSTSPHRHDCEALGLCQNRNPACRDCPEAGKPLADARQADTSGSFFWPLITVLIFGLSAALMAFLAGLMWATYGDAMVRVLDTVLRTLGA